MEDQTATIPTTPKPVASGIDKTALVLITMLLGGFGGHKFYLRKYGQGVLYALFFWTLIPGIISTVEWIIYLSKSQAELDASYPGVKGNAAAVAVAIGGGFFLVVMVGILAALAIPRFLGATDKARAAECKPILKQIATLEKAHQQSTGSLSTNLDSLGADIPVDASFEYRVELIDADRFVVKAILTRPLGKAQIGEEVTYSVDEGLSASGELGALLSKPTKVYHDND